MQLICNYSISTSLDQRTHKLAINQTIFIIFYLAPFMISHLTSYLPNSNGSHRTQNYKNKLQISSCTFRLEGSDGYITMLWVHITCYVLEFRCSTYILEGSQLVSCESLVRAYICWSRRDTSTTSTSNIEKQRYGLPEVEVVEVARKWRIQ